MTKDYKADLKNRLRDPEYAVQYLDAILSDEDDENLEERFLMALRDVASSYGFTNVAGETNLNRQNLYKTLSESGNPELRTLTTLLKAMGIRLSVAKCEDQEEAS